MLLHVPLALNGSSLTRLLITFEITEEMVRRAEQAGYDALVWTVDGPRLGNKRTLMRKIFDYSQEFTCPNWNVSKAGDAVNGFSIQWLCG